MKDETLYTTREVATKLRVSEDYVRQVFSSEPGVIVLPSTRPTKKPYRCLRIPQSTLDNFKVRHRS